jgi:Flp pilus assembly CpaF family ATPase
MQDLIAEAIDLIVSIVRVGTGRRIKEVCRVNGYDKTTGQYRLEFIGE